MLKDKTHPLFEVANDLWQKSGDFRSAAGDRAIEKHGQKFNMAQLVDATIEQYEYCQQTTLLEHYLNKSHKS